MSYLDLPRIHFKGRFFADPGTVNNDPSHYDPAVTDPSPWQTPQGQNDFAFVDCRVVTVTDLDGRDSTSDPLLGAAMQTVVPHGVGGDGEWREGFSSKLVDLDVYQQAVTQIFGMKLRFLLRGEAGGILQGTVDVATLNSTHFDCVLPKRGWAGFDGYGSGSYGGDSNATGVFQSWFRVKQEDWPVGSPVLDQLKARTEVDPANQDILLSLRYVPDGYVNVPDTGNPNYLFGRVVGTLGPVVLNDPKHNPGQRWMNPTYHPADPENPAPWNVPAFYGCPFKVDTQRKMMVLDLANSIAKKTVGGDRVDLGNVVAHVGPPSSRTALGPVDTSQFAYDNRGGLAEVPVTDQQLTLLQENPVVLTADGLDFPSNPVLAEADDGVHVACDQRVVRMPAPMDATAPDDPDMPPDFPGITRVQTMVRFTRFGKPVSGLAPGLKVISVSGHTAGITVPPWVYPGNSPSAQGALEANIGATDINGFALVTLTAKADPGSRTEQLDGQLYFVYPYDPTNLNQTAPPWGVDPAKPGTGGTAGSPPVQEQQLSLVIWSHYPENPSPEWSEIQAMMVPYVKLYPAMKELIDLTDEHTFHTFCSAPPWALQYAHMGSSTEPVMGICMGAIEFFMSRSFMNDPIYMPISRDFSPNKYKTLMHYCYGVLSANPNLAPCPPPQGHTAGSSPEDTEQGGNDA